MQKIPVLRKDGSIRAYIIVDDCDYKWLSRWRWSLDSNGYAKRGITIGGRNGLKRTILMHRQLMDLEHGDTSIVDHINGNILDNRRSNLRLVSVAENRQNIKSEYGASSKYVGVTWNQNRRKWQVQLSIGGKTYYLGLYNDEDAAGKVAIDFRAANLPYSKEAAIS